MTKDAAKPKKANRKLIGKRKFLLKRFTTPSLRFARRQASKGWLETHVWHAKRMHMRTTSFGFRLATKPTMKAYRATARAAVSGALVHDASYVRHLVIESHNLDALVALIDTLAGATCKPRPGAKRFLSGARACDFVALKAADSLEDAQRVPLGPVAVIWDAQDNEDEMDVDNERKKKKQRSPRHRVLLRCHPLILSPLRTTLDVLRSSLASSSAPSASVDVRELELLSFDLTGKQSTDVLKRAFQLAKDHRADNNGSGSAAANESKAAAWRALDFHAGPQAVPRGMVLSVQVWDPRLSFPPAHRSTSQATAGANDETLLVPSKALARTTDEQQFWRKSDATAAAAAAPKPRQTKAQLDRRRSRLLIPGQRLTPVIGLDESLPLALVQRTYGGGGSGGEEDDALHGWTVLAPRGWGMAIWMSFVHGGARVAGLEQMDQVAHESLAPRFPADWPLLADDVRGSYEREWTTEKMERWVRRPPLKRADYARLGNTTVEHALESDLRKILRGADDDDDEPWLLFGRPLSLVGDALAQFVREGNAQSTADVLKACGEVIAREWHKDAEAQDAVVRVCIEPVSRGTVSENAMIYLAPDGYDLSQAQVSAMPRHSLTEAFAELRHDVLRCTRARWACKKSDAQPQAHTHSGEEGGTPSVPSRSRRMPKLPLDAAGAPQPCLVACCRMTRVWCCSLASMIATESTLPMFRCCHDPSCIVPRQLLAPDVAPYGQLARATSTASTHHSAHHLMTVAFFGSTGGCVLSALCKSLNAGINSRARTCYRRRPSCYFALT